MPLQDHFRPPLSLRRHWHAFHNAWATFIASALNSELPEGYFAESNIQFGSEIDGDSVEVHVYDSVGPTLAGAIELVSPSNKDRPAQRDAFVSKCAAYLQAGLGVMVVDVVTDRGGDLHGELLARFGAVDPDHVGLYASAYRPVDRSGQANLDIWREPLALGSPLPVLPLGLKGGPCLPVDLEASYERTRREQRMVGIG
jgi:hypothetical protein